MVSTPCTQPARAACAGNVLAEALNPAGQPIDVTGASAILNIGHWVTYTAPVLAHTAGTDTFTYMAGGDDDQSSWSVTKFVG